MNARNFNRFHSKQDGMNRAKKFHLCTACLNNTPTIWKVCPTCGATDANRQYCMSKAELNRAAELCLAQRTGIISDLKFQPRFDLVVDGVKIATYVADFQYMEHNERNSLERFLVVEDTKPGGDFMDAVAKIKIDLFNAINAKHGLKVRISRR